MIGYWCEECHGFGKHKPGCPYYEEEKEYIGTCDLCENPIYDTDDHIKTEFNGMIHKNCSSFEDIVEYLGGIIYRGE